MLVVNPVKYLLCCAACSSPKADIVFVVDSSQSIGSQNFNTMKNFLRNVVDSFDVSKNKVRVGLIQFSNSSRIHFSLQQYSNEQDVKDAISEMSYIAWSMAKRYSCLSNKITHSYRIKPANLNDVCSVYM